MARYVNFRDLFIMDFRAAAIQMVDEIRNGLFISRNELGRKNDRVARLNFDRLVIIQSDSMKNRQRLSLTTGRYKGHALRRQYLPPFSFGHEAPGDAQLAQLGGDLAVSDHAADSQ